MTYDLPVPPSSNNGYFNNQWGGRTKTKEVDAWKVEAGQMLRRQKPVALTRRVDLLIEVDESACSVQSDITNRVKFVEDLLVAHGVLKNDSMKYVASVTSRWAKGIGACRVTVKEAA
jgi:Holliday junction resolvase RusA-like endonuclease